jgi:trans-2,3-dihydro-3-hydroxyanthranilate isomerase
MPAYRYRVVDVFSQNILEGNPLAVFPEASGIDDPTMQKIARELNLSETTFLFPPTRKDCAAQVRIFTPGKELIFAGHPTIGTSYVLVDEGRVGPHVATFALEEKVGPVEIRVEAGDRPLIWLTTPSIRAERTYSRELCARALGFELADLLDFSPQIFSAGNPNVFIPLKDKSLVDRAQLTSDGMASLRVGFAEPLCVYVFTPTSEGAYSRMFAPDLGVAEDPATGSAAGPLAAYMMQHGLVSSSSGTRFVSEQGTKMGRRSFLYVRIAGEQGKDGIHVGGYVAPLAEGTMQL